MIAQHHLDMLAASGITPEHAVDRVSKTTLPHITVRGPGRCTACSFHVVTQGHRESCDGTAPVEPDEPVPDSRSFRDWLDKRRGRAPQPRRRTEDVGDIAQPGMNPRYVGAAIRDDLDELAAATEGSRNHTLHDVACNVFEFVKAGHADETAARAELERIATAIGLGHYEYEIQATLRSAWGRVSPRNVPTPASVAPAYTIESPTS